MKPLSAAGLRMHRLAGCSPLNAALVAFLAYVGPVHAAEPPPVVMEVIGRGPVVVLESGLGQARKNWDLVSRALTPCLTVVTYDRPGIGESPPPQNPEGPVLATTIAADLLARLRARGLPEPYILVGHSLGGLYVQAFARRHPSAVAGLVLIDASSPLEPPGVFVSTRPPKPGSVEAAEELGVGPSVAALLSGPPLPPVPLVVLTATDHGDTPEREAEWRDVQQRTAALSPKGRFTLVNGGHFLQIDQPAAVAAAVLAVAAEAGADISACKH
jgi:pimeloyl-ACP methyl ester carboxylesterase